MTDYKNDPNGSLQKADECMAILRRRREQNEPLLDLNEMPTSGKAIRETIAPVSDFARYLRHLTRLEEDEQTAQVVSGHTSPKEGDES
jgi:hypothetical protein